MTDIFGTIIEMSIKASFVIVAILIVRFIIRKAPKRFSYILWAAAGLRLCMPEGFKVDFSFLSLNTPQELIGTVGNLSNGTTATFIDEGADTIQNTVGGATNTVTTPVMEFDWLGLCFDILALIWVIGASAMIIYGIISYIKIHRQMSNAILQSGNIYFSDRINAPFTLGFLRPKIYLPYGLNETEQNCIISHEKCHIKRLDHIVKLFAYILLSIHWFNPLCWIAFNKMSLDMEMSCDEIIFRKENYSEMKKDYTKALVSIASKKSFPAPTPISFDDGRSTKKRVTNILKFKKSKLWINILCYILCLFVLVACGVDAESNYPESVGNEVFGELPYNIYYSSNGDGTCIVDDILIDKDYRGEIHLVIPEKSPDGEKVIGILSKGFGEEHLKLVPLYLTPYRYKEISHQIENAKVGDFERNRKIFRSFYQLEVENDVRYYVLEPYVTYDEVERIANILKDSGYSHENRTADTQEVLNILSETKADIKELETSAYSYIYKNGTKITELTVPSTLELVNSVAFRGCINLKSVHGMPEDCNNYSEELLNLIG